MAEAEVVRIFPRRYLNQCYLWDCPRGNQPYCNGNHETLALTGDDIDQAIVFVDGIDGKQRDALAFKVLTLKFMEQSCGVPTLDANILLTQPWHSDAIDFNRENGETARSWVFLSEDGMPGYMWVLKKRKDVYGFRCAMYKMYPNPDFGTFTLIRYTSPVYEDAFYCMNFKERYVGMWKKHLDDVDTENAKKIETGEPPSRASIQTSCNTLPSHCLISHQLIKQSMRPKALDKKLQQEWIVPLKSIEDVYEKFRQLSLGNLKTSPWSELDGLQPKTQIIDEKLGKINSHGFLTINSQPPVNAAPSDNPAVGWGGPGGYVYQKAFLEFFCSRDKLEKFVEIVKAYPSITYMAVNKQGNWLSNVGQSDANAVTWGVFPAKGILQPTIVDPVSFKVRKEKAFEIWSLYWTNLYPEDDPSRKLLTEVKNSYYLVSIVDNDYISGDIFKSFEYFLNTETAPIDRSDCKHLPLKTKPVS